MKIGKEKPSQLCCEGLSAFFIRSASVGNSRQPRAHQQYVCTPLEASGTDLESGTARRPKVRRSWLGRALGRPIFGRRLRWRDMLALSSFASALFGIRRVIDNNSGIGTRSALLQSLVVVALILIFTISQPQTAHSVRSHASPSRSAVAPRNAKSSQWWPPLGPTELLAPQLAQPTLEFEANATALLEQLISISTKCRATSNSSDQHEGALTIKRVISQHSRWVCTAQTKGSSSGVVCSEAVLSTDKPVEAVMWTLYSLEERLRWDRASFRVYELVCQSAMQNSSGALGDVIYCRMPAPPGMSERDTLQERFLLRLPEGGFAIVMQSCSEAKAAALKRAPGKNVVRAVTLISGFLLQPEASGIRVTALSQTDLGGDVPQWVQEMAKRASGGKALEWLQRLEEDCNQP